MIRIGFLLLFLVCCSSLVLSRSGTTSDSAPQQLEQPSRSDWVTTGGSVSDF